MSFYFNYYYAKKYDGKVILRFDDTNPKKEKLEYYDAIKQDLNGLKLIGMKNEICPMTWIFIINMP